MQNKKVILVLIAIAILFFLVGGNLYNGWDNWSEIKNQKERIAGLEVKFSLLERSHMQKNEALRDSLTSLKAQNYLLVKKLNNLEMDLAREVKDRKMISRKLTELSQQKTVKAPTREKIANLQKKINLLNKTIAAAERLSQIQNDIKELKLIQYFAPNKQEIFRLLTNECLFALNSSDWSLLAALDNLTLFLQKNQEFTDLRKHKYNQQLKALLEKKGIKFKYNFSNEAEYFGYLLQLFQTENNQVKQGHYADIMAGLYQKPAIQAKYEKQLKQIPCPGNGRPLYEYLEKLKVNGDTAPIPPDVDL